MSTGPSKRARLEVQDFVYPNNAAELCMKILKSQKDCDVFFVVGPNRVRIGAHKLVLTAKSPVFEAMFSERWETGSIEESHEIVLEDTEATVFNSFLEYVYADVFKATAWEAVELLHFAQFYDIKTLVKPCEDLLAGQFQLDDLFKIFTSAQKYGFSDLVGRVMGHLVNKFVQLANSPTFAKADETMLIHLLKREDLFINESELFSVLLKWADKRIENSTQEPKPERKEILKNIIPLIRFPTMTAKEFAEVVTPSKILPEETTINLFMYLNSSEQIRSEIGPRIPYDKTPREGIVIDLYSERSRPANIPYPYSMLFKGSQVQDVLRFKFNWSKRAGMTLKFLKPRIASLLLQRPRYEQLLFQNSTEVTRMKLPVKVEIVLCWSKFDGCGIKRVQLTKAQYVTMRDEDETMEVVVDGWELLNDTCYQIRVKYLADPYVLPINIVDRMSDRPRNERFDYFSTKTLRPEVAEENFAGSVTLSSLGISGGSAVMDPILSFETGGKMSSGLHLVRSLRIKLT